MREWWKKATFSTIETPISNENNGKIMLFFLRVRLKKDERFTPDMYVEADFDLSKFGLDAKVICLPGHSKGSIIIRTHQ